jgi:hypothetical protein
VTLADPWASLNGQEDNYVQFFSTQVTAWGTATISASPSIAVTTDGVNGSGTALSWQTAPSAADFLLSHDSRDTTVGNPGIPAWISSVTTSGFTISIPNAQNAVHPTWS